MNDTQFKQLMDRLDDIERKVDWQANPGGQLAAEEKGLIMAKAIATGDKKQIRAATKFINGGR